MIVTYFFLLTLLITSCLGEHGDKGHPKTDNQLTNHGNHHLKCRQCNGQHTLHNCHEDTCKNGEVCYLDIEQHGSEHRIRAGCRERDRCGHDGHNAVCSQCCSSHSNCNADLCKDEIAQIHETHHSENTHTRTPPTTSPTTTMAPRPTTTTITTAQFSTATSPTLKTTITTTKISTTSTTTTTTTTTTATTTTKPTTTTISSTTIAITAPPLTCMKCYSSGLVGFTCDAVETCSTDQSCFLQQLEYESYIKDVEPTYFHGGCIRSTECSTIDTKSTDDEHGLARLIRGECCNETNCNQGKMQLYKNEYTKTTVAATTQPSTEATTVQPTTIVLTTTASATTTSLPPAESTTVAETKASTPAPVTTTVKTETTNVQVETSTGQVETTTIPVETAKVKSETTTVQAGTTTVQVETTTPPIKPVRCAVCDGPLCGLFTDAMQLCPDDAPFCLNTVVNQADGNQIITKKCATGYQCNTHWWQESSDKHVCTAFNSATAYYSDFTCSYCCTVDGCNNDLFPAQHTLFHGND